MTSRMARNRPVFSVSLPPRRVEPIQSADQQLSTQPVPRPAPTFDATEVLTNLYLGSWGDAQAEEELLRRRITRIVNVAEECDVSLSSSKIAVRKWAIKDHSDEDIAAIFDETTEFIKQGLDAGEGVLVHCRQGVSRSATIVLAYLMQMGIGGGADHLTYLEAFDYVKSRRPRISPNLGFTLALHDLDAKLEESQPICVAPSVYMGQVANWRPERIAQVGLIVTTADDVYGGYAHLCPSAQVNQCNLSGDSYGVLRTLLEVVDVIRETVEAGKLAFVVCQPGVSRAAAIIHAYLMYQGTTATTPQEEAVTLSDAFDIAQRHRACKPHVHCLCALREFERGLRCGVLA